MLCTPGRLLPARTTLDPSSVTRALSLRMTTALQPGLRALARAARPFGDVRIVTLMSNSRRGTCDHAFAPLASSGRSRWPRPTA
jgi:hypothetical protein